MDEQAFRELFAGLGPVRTRRMFGGRGAYLEERMFALQIGGEIYLKTDATTLPLFQGAGSRPFVFERAGRPTTTSYWLLPERALDDPDEAARWGRLAVAAAQRSGAASPRRRPHRRK